MAGRAGRPDFHDLGRVVILAEPGGTYSRENPFTEEEVAIRLLRVNGRGGPDTISRRARRSTWRTLLRATVKKQIRPDQRYDVGSMEPVLPELIHHRWSKNRGAGLSCHPGTVMAEHLLAWNGSLNPPADEVHDDPVDVICGAGKRRCS